MPSRLGSTRYSCREPGYDDTTQRTAAATWHDNAVLQYTDAAIPKAGIVFVVAKAAC